MADDETAESAATREDKDTKNAKELVKLWLDALALADKEEKDWRDDAAKVVDIYRNSAPRTGDVPGAKDRRFNILFSNTETVIPAIYNSTPVPDVRRRFNDDDPAGKEVADLIERALSSSVDAYDFDEGMHHDIKDMELAGRGLSRVRYKPYFAQDEAETQDDAGEEAGEPTESVAYEEVACEHVAWKHFRHGPARTWQEVPWECFDHFLTREELVKLSPKLGGKVNLDTTLSGVDDKKDGNNLKEVFKRAYVREIWDKDSRKVIFIAPSYKDAPIAEMDDPLGLTGFFPNPKPLYAIETSDDLTPVIPYHIYRDQAEELERVSRRIMALVESIKSKGAYDGSMEEIGQLESADDNTLVAIKNVARYADGKGIEGGITWWPIDPAVKALKQLVEHRESIKQVIYEITGISDILRGQTDANETATAQNIKQQWGSLRIQNKQVAIQKYARDLFRLKAEIIATKFDWKTIELMTGLSYPDRATKAQAQQAVAQFQQQAQQQAAQQQGQQPPASPPIPEQLQAILDKPAREDVESLLRNDATRNFRVDVESDSTIRADMTRNQQNMSLFLQGTAQFAAAMGPIVMTYPTMTGAVLEVYTAFARNFKLGKQAEDALDSVADKAKVASEQPQKPDPAKQAEEAKLQGEVQMMQMKMKAEQDKHEMEKEKMALQLQMEREKINLKREELDMKRQEMELDMQATQQKMAMESQQMQSKQAMQERQGAMEMEASQRQHDLGMQATEAKHETGLEMLAAKKAAAKQPARANA